MRWITAWFVCAAAVLLSPGSASASCAGTSPPSPFAFVGTVERTESMGRLAFVRAEDGGHVEVHGGETREGFATSNDRTYEDGATYEFHPIDEASPFQDDACTATRLLETAGDRPAERGSVSQPGLHVRGGSALLAGLVAAGMVWGRAAR